jgi:hypothetical protein
MPSKRLSEPKIWYVTLKITNFADVKGKE